MKRFGILRKRHPAAFLAAMVAIALAVAWVMRPGQGPGGPMDTLSNILGLLEGRSPGERSNSLTLSKTKLRPEGLTDEIDERVLGKVFPEETFLEIPAGGDVLPLEDMAALEFPAQPFEFDTADEQASDLPALALPAPGLATGPGGSLAVGGPGGGGGGNSGGGGLPPAAPPSLTTPDAVAPVPEPSTWAMMIVGMGLVAGALRRRRSLGRRERLRHAL